VVERRFQLVTAFEVFEHLASPLTEVPTMFEHAPSVLLTTELVPTADVAELSRWWYLGEAHGQHVSFFTAASFARLADHLGVRYLQLASDLHLLTRDQEAQQKLDREPDATVLESLTWSDSLLAEERANQGRHPGSRLQPWVDRLRRRLQAGATRSLLRSTWRRLLER
jgi:hypothetical protein